MRRLFFWAVIGALFALILKILNDLDVNKVTFNHRPGQCRYIKGVVNGSEDIVLLENGLILITSGVHLPFIPFREDSPGRIYAFDPQLPDMSAVELRITEGSGFAAKDFHPTGIAVWEEKGENPLVYAVDSNIGRVVVFEFLQSANTLKFLRSLSHNLLPNPNNLVLIGKDQFYVSNYLFFRNPILGDLEMMLRLPLGKVLFYDRGTFKEVLSGKKSPNGVALSKDKQYLYVAMNMEERLYVYRINADKSLELTKVVNLYTGPDNVMVDADGGVWLGAHPIMYEVLLHTHNPQYYKAPSQILRLTFSEDHSEWEMKEVIADSGRLLQAATVAVPWGRDKLLVGTLLHKASICDL